MAKLRTSIRTYAERIRGHWHNATTSIMEVAHLCAEANKRLSPAEKKKLVELLPFSNPTFSKLAQIGDDRRLQSSRVQKLLPPSYSIIYSVAQLEDTEFNAAIKDGIVNPTLKRSDLQEWLQKKKFRSRTAKPQSLNLPEAFYAAIRLTGDLSSEQTAQLERVLDQIRVEFKAEIIRPRDRYAEAKNRWYARVQKYMRIEARRIVREATKRAVSHIPKKQLRKMSEKARMKTWGFASDEVEIDDLADDQRIQEVLDYIGHGDEFARLRDEALSAIEQPEPPARLVAQEDQGRTEVIEEQFHKLRRGREKSDLTKFLDFK